MKYFQSCAVVFVLVLSALAQQAPVTSSSAGQALSGQVVGEAAVGISASKAKASPAALYVSALCGDSTGLTCPNYTDESVAIVAAETQCKNGGAVYSSCHVIDDMCGTQTISVQPWNISGKFDFLSNCSSNNPHVWSLDGIGTLTTTTSGLLINGMGGNGFLQNPTNVYIQACNPVIDNCVNGGFTMPHATVSGTVVAGANMTVTLGSAIPISGNGPGVAAPGRLLCIQGSTTQVTNNGCWVINVTTDTTHFIVGVVSGSTVSCTPGTCGTAYLDTPIAEIGASTGSGVFDVHIDNLLFNCHYVFGCAGFVNGTGQENTGFGLTHVSNTAVYYGRLDQSAAYNGANTAGATNSGSYGPWSGNINPELCSKTGGCACVTGSGSGVTGAVSNVCTAGLVAVGGTVSCGAGINTGTAPAVLSPDPCDNPNFVGFLFTGIAGTQGFGEILGHTTASIADKSIGGGAPIPGLAGGVHNFGSDGCNCSTGAQPGSVAATSGVGMFVGGAHMAIGDSHFEYFYVDAEIGGNSALNATWQEYYGSILTSGVLMHGGLWAFQPGGVGLDIAQSGASATTNDVFLEGVNIGNQSGTLISDNISGITVTGAATEQVETYLHGHGSPPSVYSSSPTVGLSNARVNNYAPCPYAADVTNTNSYAITVQGLPASIQAGLCVKFKVTNANTAGATLNVTPYTGATAYGAIALDKRVPGGVAALAAANDLAAGGVYSATYDGTEWVVEAVSNTVTNAGAFSAAHLFVESNNTSGQVKVTPNVALDATDSFISKYNGLATAGTGMPSVRGAPAAITIGSGASIGSTSLCSTVLCPSGLYFVHVYVEITTACTTTGSYAVNLIYTDDQGSKTVLVPLTGTGVNFASAGAGVITDSLALASTANFGQADVPIFSTGAASINYSTTAGACGSGGPMVGKMYISVSNAN